MRVIPGGSWGIGLEGVGELASRRDGALRDASSTVHKMGSLLVLSVVVNRQGTAWHLVDDSDFQCVTFTKQRSASR